jgi:uncharacterized Fe-S cluster-containing radical SAM superfamily protein
MPLTIKKKAQGEATVSVKNKQGGEMLSTTSTAPLHTDGTLVGFKMGYTKNLGNYESVRVEVSLVLPTYTENVEHAYKVAKDWADKKLTEAVDEIESDTQ